MKFQSQKRIKMIGPLYLRGKPPKTTFLTRYLDGHSSFTPILRIKVDFLNTSRLFFRKSLLLSGYSYF